MNFVIKVIVGMVVMGVLDAPMIKYVIQPTLEKHIGDMIAKSIDGIAALLFYVGYVGMVVYLTGRFAESTREAAIGGALLGLFAYGTYELTNKAVLRDWPWSSVVVDMIWGAALTAIVAGSAYYVGVKLS